MDIKAEIKQSILEHADMLHIINDDWGVDIQVEDGYIILYFGTLKYYPGHGVDPDDYEMEKVLIKGIIPDGLSDEVNENIIDSFTESCENIINNVCEIGLRIHNEIVAEQNFVDET